MSDEITNNTQQEKSWGVIDRKKTEDYEQRLYAPETEVIELDKRVHLAYIRGGWVRATEISRINGSLLFMQIQQGEPDYRPHLIIEESTAPILNEVLRGLPRTGVNERINNGRDKLIITKYFEEDGMFYEVFVHNERICRFEPREKFSSFGSLIINDNGMHELTKTLREVYTSLAANQ